jgi:hypothetical protein
MHIPPIDAGNALQYPCRSDEGATPLDGPSLLIGHAAPGLLKDLQKKPWIPNEIGAKIAAHVDAATHRCMRQAGKHGLGPALRYGAEVATKSVTVRSANELAKALEIYKKGGLDTLAVEDASLTDDDLKGLPVSLRTLILDHCEGITPAGLAHLNRLRLTSLNVNHCKLSDAGARVLASNTTLILLDLDHNEIGDAGAQALAGNTTFTSLFLSRNRIGNAGAQALASNATLTLLTVRFNEIGETIKQQLRTRAINAGVLIWV